MTKVTSELKEGKLEAKFGLPSDVAFCKSCVISNQRPSSTVEFYNTIEEKKKKLLILIKMVFVTLVIGLIIKITKLIGVKEKQN